MIRRGVMYRRLWYARRRNEKRIHIFTKLIIILVILAVIISCMERKLMPYLLDASEQKTREIVTLAVNAAIRDKLTGGIDFEDLVTVERNYNGDIISVRDDMAKLNELSADISAEVQNRLAGLEQTYIEVPLGAMFGKTILSASGPDIRLNIKLYGNVETRFRSEYAGDGNSRERYRLYMEVKTTVKITAPLIGRKTEMVTELPVADSILFKL